VVTTAADARALLADERFGVLPEAEPDGPPGTVRWLRAQVSRFVNGPDHARRRAVLEAELARVAPLNLAAAAGRYAEALLADRTPIDLLARRAPAAALAELLGVGEPEVAAAEVGELAPAYFPGAEPAVEARADAAVAALLTRLDGAPLEVAIARVTLLVQGYEATGALIDAARAHGGVLDAVLRERPPLPAIRRVALVDAGLAGAFVRAGEPVVIDVGAASDPEVLTFGGGRRPCPARSHALAAAAAVLDALSARSCPPVPGN